MVVPPGVGAQEVGGAKLPVERHAKPLTEQEKVLHALNRFTFGPRPGDVAAVEGMGVERWFEMQLHPERMDDSAFRGGDGAVSGDGVAGGSAVGEVSFGGGWFGR